MNMQEAQTQLEEFRRDIKWYHTHYPELRERYPDHWVAVYNEEVVAAALDMDAMYAELKRRHTPINKAYIKYLSTESATWTLAAA